MCLPALIVRSKVDVSQAGGGVGVPRVRRRVRRPALEAFDEIAVTGRPRCLAFVAPNYLRDVIFGSP